MEFLLFPQGEKSQPLFACPCLTDGKSGDLGLTVPGKNAFPVALDTQWDLIGTEICKVPDVHTCHVSALLKMFDIALEELRLKLFGELQGEHGVMSFDTVSTEFSNDKGLFNDGTEFVKLF